MADVLISSLVYDNINWKQMFLDSINGGNKELSSHLMDINPGLLKEVCRTSAFSKLDDDVIFKYVMKNKSKSKGILNSLIPKKIPLFKKIIEEPKIKISDLSITRAIEFGITDKEFYSMVIPRVEIRYSLSNSVDHILGIIRYNRFLSLTLGHIVFITSTQEMFEEAMSECTKKDPTLSMKKVSVPKIDGKVSERIDGKVSERNVLPEILIKTILGELGLEEARQNLCDAITVLMIHEE